MADEIQNQVREITMVPIDKLVPSPVNRNKHPESQIERLVELIKYQGFRQPVIVSTLSGHIVVGHGRWEAAKRAGLKEIPVIFQPFESPEQEHAFQISDNAIAAWAELDMKGINMDLAELGPDFNLDMLGIEGFVLEPAEFPSLSGSDPSFQTRTFVLSNEQNDILDEAMAKAKKEEDCSDELNQNANGNTLAAILKRYIHG